MFFWIMRLVYVFEIKALELILFFLSVDQIRASFVNRPGPTQTGPSRYCKDNNLKKIQFRDERTVQTPEPTIRTRSYWPVATHGCGAGDRPRLPGVAGSGSLELTRQC